VRHGRIDLIEVAAAPHGSDHGGSAPERKLSGHRSDPAEQAVDEGRRAGHWAVAEDRPVCSDPGIPRHAPSSSLTESGSSTACSLGMEVNCAAVPNGRYDCAP
jgi:hypothetical protein